MQGSGPENLTWLTLSETTDRLLGPPQNNSHIALTFAQVTKPCFPEGISYVGDTYPAPALGWSCPWNATLPCPFQHLCVSSLGIHKLPPLWLQSMSPSEVLSPRWPSGVHIPFLWYSLVPFGFFERKDTKKSVCRGCKEAGKEEYPSNACMHLCLLNFIAVFKP